jgi:hypothetical protein
MFACMTPPVPRSPGRKLLGGIAIAVLMACGLLLWWHGRAPVREDQVGEFLDRTLGAGRVRFSVVRLVTLQRDGAGAQLAVVATARSLAPLYVRVDTSDYLQRTFRADPAATWVARRLLEESASARSPEFQAAGPFPEDPYRASVLQMTSPAGSAFDFQGIIDARLGGGGPRLTLVSGGFVGDGPRGDLQNAFPGPAFSAGDPRDDARLRSLVGDLEAFAGRVARLRVAPDSGHVAGAGGPSGGFLGQITPGRILRGTAVEDGLEQGTVLYLEIVDVSPGGEVRALLRNEGGWLSARAFDGAWSPGEGAEGPILSLASRPNQAVRGAGPFLEDAQAWSFALRWDPARGLFGKSRRYSLQFRAVSPQQANEAKDRLNREFAGALDATRPGLTLIGTATSRSSGASEPILMRFVSRSQDGASVDARIESTSNSWRRPLHGAIATNAKRSGGEPIRLLAASNDAVGDAPAESVFGCRDDLELRLGASGASLLGGDARFTYRLAAASDADYRRLESERLERTARLVNAFRPGIAYDGVLREEQGFRSRARLEIDSLDPKTGAMSARIVSLSRPNVFRAFSGALDPSGSSVALNAAAREAFQPDESFDAPFLKTSAAAVLRLSLSGGIIAGRIEGDEAWTIEFPARILLGAQIEPVEGPASPSGAPTYPPFPTEGGAYLLSGGGWSALPRNQGHRVVETVRPETDAHLSLNLLEDVGQGIGLIAREKQKQKVSYFEFPGRDPRPESRGPAITLLFVGHLPSGRPPVELAPCETTKEGRRRVMIMNGSPDVIRFGETRVAAYVREFAPGVVMLTTTSPLDPGPYVFSADTGYELTCE